MVYIVIEIQSDGATASTLTNAYTDRADAENKYHTVLAYASKSAVPMHSVALLSDEGYFIKSERYIHNAQAE